MVILHLPIGLLIGVAVLELRAWYKRRKGDPTELGAPPSLLWISAVATVFAASSGWILHQESGYSNEDMLVWHERLGIATAVGATICAILHARRKDTAYRACLALTIGTLIPAGHIGGNMIHGEGFLSEPFAASVNSENEEFVPMATDDPDPEAVDTPILASYEEHLAPLLKARCSACHGKRKQKGELRLDSPAWISIGGEGGEVLTPGDPDDSEMIIRLSLPLDDEDHMPPENKRQPTAAELDLVRAWIAAGASFTAPFPLAEGAELPAIPLVEEEEKLGPAPADAIAALRNKLVHVQVVAADTNELWVDFSAVCDQIGDREVLSLLAPLEDHIADLTLSRTRISDKAMVLVGDMLRLRRLDLRQTDITDVGLAELNGHETLEELNLSQTKLNANALETLLSLNQLQKVWLWDSGLEVDSDTLPQAAVGVVIDNAEITAVGTAIPAPAVVPAVASLDPINTACPVTGKPVDPNYSVVFEGQVIAFCCPNCPKTFWNEPDAFRVKLP